MPPVLGPGPPRHPLRQPLCYTRSPRAQEYQAASSGPLPGSQAGWVAGEGVPTRLCPTTASAGGWAGLPPGLPPCLIQGLQVEREGTFEALPALARHKV